MILNEEVIKKHGFALDEFLLMLAVLKNPEINKLIKKLMERRVLENTIFTDYLVLKDEYRELVNIILKELEMEEKPKEINYNELADKLRELYPKGRKTTPDGRSYSWRDTTAVIAQKLKVLAVKYEFKFTEEEAIKAVKDYVEKNTNNPYMQVLKYYLIKNLTDGIKSDFMSDIQNKNDEENSDTDWTTELR